MEILGYDTIKNLEQPVDPIIDGVETEVQALSGLIPPQGSLSMSVKGGPRCEQYLRYGVDIETIVRSTIRNPIFIHQGPKLVRLLQSQYGRAHMKKDQSVSFFKVVRAEQDTVRFNLFPSGSSIHEIDKPMAVINLRVNELLYVLGGVIVQIECRNESIVIWDGFSALPVGMDIDNEDILDFVDIKRT